MLKLKQYIHVVSNWLPTLLLAALMITALFPIDKVFITPLSFSLGKYSDFTTYRLYGFDIILVLTVTLIGISSYYRIPRGEKEKSQDQARGVKGFLSRGGITILVLSYVILGTRITTWWEYYQIETSLRILMIVIVANHFFSVSHETIKTRFLQKTAALVFAIELITIFFQVLKQKSIGLLAIGEPHISSNQYDVAKVVSHGTVWLRAYGTFPHPNILGFTFCIITLILVYKFLVQKNKLWLLVCISMASLVLASTASRAAVLSLGIGLGVLLTLLFHMKHETKLALVKKFSLLSVIISLPFLTFSPLWLPEAGTRTQAATDRVVLTKAGFKIVKDNLLLGVGNGQSVFHMKQYLPSNTPTWDIQPIHNVWILIAAEKGLPGLIIFIVFLYLLIRNNLRKVENKTPILWLSIGAMLLVVSLFDHYLYTLLQGQIILWTWIGWGLAIYDNQSQLKS